MTITITPPSTRPRLEIAGPDVAGTDQILTSEAIDFLTDLHVRFSGRRHKPTCCSAASTTRRDTPTVPTPTSCP